MSRKFYEVAIDDGTYSETYAVTSSNSPTRAASIGKAIRRFFIAHISKKRVMDVKLIVNGLTEYEYRNFYNKRRLSNGVRTRKRR